MLAFSQQYGCYRAAIDLTTKLLIEAGQDNVETPTQHSPDTLQVFHLKHFMYLNQLSTYFILHTLGISWHTLGISLDTFQVHLYFSWHTVGISPDTLQIFHLAHSRYFTWHTLDISPDTLDIYLTHSFHLTHSRYFTWHTLGISPDTH